MEQPFYELKKQSKRSFGFIVVPLIGILVLVLSDVAIWGLTQLLRLFAPAAVLDALEFELFLFAIPALLLLLWVKGVENSPWGGLGFTGKGAGKDFLIGWCIGAAMLVSCVLIMMLFGSAKIIGFTFSTKFLLRLIVAAIAWTIQSSTEEFLTRGWMFSSLAAKYTVPVGVAVSSLFFAAMHLLNDGLNVIAIVDLVLFGILTALYMLKTNSVWGVCGIHAAWNFFQGSVFAFPVSGTLPRESLIQVSTSGPVWLSGGNFGVEGTLISNLVQLLIIGWLCCDRFIKKRRPAISRPAAE